jgi:hypothetical protein
VSKAQSSFIKFNQEVGMKTLQAIIVTTLFLPAAVFSQITWQTTDYTLTGEACQVSSNIIKITVNPFHLDVEEEATITAPFNDTWQSWWGDSKSLEITGNFTLTSGKCSASFTPGNNYQPRAITFHSR